MHIHSPPEEKKLELRLAWIKRITKLAKYISPRRISRFCNRSFYLEDDRESSLKLIVPYHRGLFLHIDTDSWLERWILNRGSYEGEVVEFLDRYLKPGMIAFDVGANIGCHTLVMANAVGPTGRVFAFEPHPTIYERLRANVALNRFAQVEMLPMGLSDCAAPQVLFAPLDEEYNQGLASLHRSNLGEHCQEITVPFGTLDEFVRHHNLERLDLLKIDVEGHEYQVLRGARQVLQRCRPLLIFEFSRRQWTNAEVQPERVADYLTELGYALFVLRKTFLTSVEHGISEECNLVAVPRAVEASVPRRDLLTAVSRGLHWVDSPVQPTRGGSLAFSPKEPRTGAGFPTDVPP